MADLFTPDELAELTSWADVKAALAEIDPVAPAPARKAKSKRRKRRLGRIVLKIEADEASLAEYLIETGRLALADSLSRPAVEATLAGAVADLVKRWHQQRL